MSQYIVKAAKTYLKSPLTAAATSVILRELVDTKGNALTLANFGTWGVVVVKQGDNIEMIKFDALSTAGDGTVTLTVASSGRYLDNTSPYAGHSTGLSFQAGADVIVTNDPYTMMQFGNLNNENTWSAVQTFSIVPKSSANAVASDELINKGQLDAAYFNGSITLQSTVINGTAAETFAIDQVIYLDVSSGRWYKADADAAANVENVMLGISRGAGTAGIPIVNGITILGQHIAASAIFTANTAYFASNTAGGFSTSAGTKEVSLGFATSTTNFILYPRYNQQLTEDQQDALDGNSGTPSSANKYVTEAGLTAGITARLKFGGTGADGALAITSGTTTIDLGGASTVTKNYTSISITGTGVLAFSNPHANGTLIALKSQGAVTLTSSATPMIDASGMGGASSQNGNSTFLPTLAGITSSVGYAYPLNIIGKRINFSCGAGGSPGAATGNPNGVGAGGAGGGGLYIEVGGALNFTTTNGISVAGKVGGSGNNGFASGNYGATGGGGGGGGGVCVIVYTTLTAATGTITVTGGAGGAGGAETLGTGGGGTAGGVGGINRFNSGAGGAGLAGGGGNAGGAGGAGGTTANGTAGSVGAAAGGGGGGGGGSAGSYLIVLNTEFV